MEKIEQPDFSDSDSKDRLESGCEQLKCYNSKELFGSNNEIQINHQGELYRIRITRNGKLIMNK